MLNLSKMLAAPVAPVASVADAEAVAAMPAIELLGLFDADTVDTEATRDTLLINAGRELAEAIADAVGVLSEADLSAIYRDRKAAKDGVPMKAAAAVTVTAKAVYGYDTRTDTQKAAWRKMESRAVTVGLALDYLRAEVPEVAGQWDRAEASLSGLATALVQGPQEMNREAKKAEAEAQREREIAEEIEARGFVDAAAMQVLSLADMASAVAAALDNGHFTERDADALANLFDSVDAFRAARAKAIGKRKAA